MVSLGVVMGEVFIKGFMEGVLFSKGGVCL